MAMARRLRTSSEASEHEDDMPALSPLGGGAQNHKPALSSSTKPFFHKKIFRRFSLGGGIGTGMRTIEPVPKPRSNQSDKFLPKTSKASIRPERRLSAPSCSNPTSYVRISPQNYLDSLLRSRGYSTERFETLQTAYYNKPTPLQLTSYNVYLITLLRQDDKETFRAVLNSGISPNPCDTNGSSLLHTVCRRGNHAFLRIMLNELRVPVQISDAEGLTPLHEACRNNNGVPSFEAVQLLLDQDPRLFYFVDSRGLTPLEYIRKSDWPAWMVFLRRNRDRYWPVQPGGKAYTTINRRQSLSGVTSHHQTQQRPPYLALLGPNSRPLADPSLFLPSRIAERVAAGKMQPEDAAHYRCRGDKKQVDKNGCVDMDSDDDDSFHNDDYHDDGGFLGPGDSSCCGGGAISIASNITWDEEETAEVLRSLTVAPAKAKPIAWCDPSATKKRRIKQRRNHYLRRRQFNEPQNLYFR